MCSLSQGNKYSRKTPTFGNSNNKVEKASMAPKPKTEKASMAQCDVSKKEHQIYGDEGTKMLTSSLLQEDLTVSIS